MQKNRVRVFCDKCDSPNTSPVSNADGIRRCNDCGAYFDDPMYEDRVRPQRRWSDDDD